MPFFRAGGNTSISVASSKSNPLPGRIAQSVMCLATDVCLDCRSRGREFDPGPFPYFRGD